MNQKSILTVGRQNNMSGKGGFLAIEAKKEIRKARSKDRAKINAWFFRTGKGDYGEGDKFIGVSVPFLRKTAIKFSDMTFVQTYKLLKSPYHEDRALALLILVRQFEKGDKLKQKEIYNFYISSTSRINNWDLVDLSAYKIVGRYIFDRDKRELFRLARSKSVWERRIAMVSTFFFIKKKQSDIALRLAEMLLKDSHHLIHKAVGWMLREVGKNCSNQALRYFLDKHCEKMPRVTLRYALEKFPKSERLKYLGRKKGGI